MKDDLHFLRLWDLYSPLLTETQKEITDLYFNYDLSLGEIAEQKGVSRQSVSDCLQKCRKQLEKYEEKLGFMKMLDDFSAEYSSYMTVVNRWTVRMRGAHPEFLEELDELEKALDRVHEEFDVEKIDIDDGSEIAGKSFRDGE